MVKYVESILRYPGGKRRGLSKILTHFPKDILEYREPFIGGGSVFVGVKQLLGDDISYTINDLNFDLVCLWRSIQADGEGFRNYIYDIKQGFDTGKDLYNFYSIRSSSMSNLDIAARFFILNRITFSGLIDCGGYSNESYEKRFTTPIIDRIIPLSDLLQNVIITFGDYLPHLQKNGDGVFIFMDPPYLIAKKSQLYGVHGNLHVDFDHKKLSDDVRNCVHKWMMTCENSPEMNELFSYAKSIIPWNLKYGMTNAKNSSTRNGEELLISNYPMWYRSSYDPKKYSKKNRK